ncbi:MAG: hypothetical protein RL514_3896 [Verrucomicrobiota bacterium]|jgi:hypothetical protein
MFEKYNFEFLRLRYVKGAMTHIPSFRPDGKNPADCDALMTSATTARTTFVNANTTLQLAQGEFNEDITEAHDICVQVYAIMKNRYRKDSGSASAISSLLTVDRSAGETITRIEGMSSLWAQLPNPPDSATPFKAWDTMDKAAFDAYLTAIKGTAGPPVVIGTQAAKAAAESAMELAGAGLHTAENAMEDFNTAALIQGRGQFPDGTANREVIDAIPTQPATQLPGQAIITAATSPGAGQAHLEFNAPHMTSGDVLHKAPGAPAFVKVADDIIEKFYNATGLAAGAHEYKVIPRNSRGDGPESAVSVVNVT